MSRPIGTPAELERRRRRAVALVEQGEDRASVARILGVCPKTLARWLRLARQPEGLAAKRHPGPTPGLSAEQLKQLEVLLLQGAHKHGWHNQLWTAARVAKMIERHFQRHYHPEHVRKMLKRRLGWTSQKPKRKSREGNDKEAERWVGDEFPRIVRDAYRRDATLVLLDESGFQLTPCVRRSLAPRGRTPIVEAWDRRDKISAISCITVSPVAGRLYLYFDLLADKENVHAEDVVAFVRRLHRALGPITVIWDRNNIHSKSRLVKAWLAKHPDVVVENFPGYMPDLNPEEGVWGWTKYGRLPNLAANDLGWLRDYVWEELEHLQKRPDLLQGFIRETGLPGLLKAG